jgi:hypothetical protein
MIFKSLLVLFSVCMIEPVNPTSTKFPAISGEGLDGKKISLPVDCAGKKTLVGMAYSAKAQDALVSWYEPMFDKFVSKVGMFDYQYDVNLYFIPMFIGLKQSLYDATLKDLKSQNRKDLYPYVMFYKGDLAPYDEQLNMKDKNIPYLFVLNERGDIIHATNGNFSESKMEAIEEVLSK